ncbi:Galanin peptide [Fukomys damarensis]|uniref:Galanin peptides n=1 Tax=Fukomys damarensis TaxID=885580 RepID=A0A091D874_FUKDA|nr:Galanin peptide [Fukomys damarensis]
MEKRGELDLTRATQDTGVWLVKAPKYQSQQLGKALEEAKEKRGWTLNSAGYLLGPHAIDNHRSFSDKYGLAGKRELQPNGDLQTGSFDRSLPESNIVRTIIEFLTFLHLKGIWAQGAHDESPDAAATGLRTMPGLCYPAL